MNPIPDEPRVVDVGRSVPRCRAGGRTGTSARPNMKYAPHEHSRDAPFVGFALGYLFAMAERASASARTRRLRAMAGSQDSRGLVRRC